MNITRQYKTIYYDGKSAYEWLEIYNGRMGLESLRKALRKPTTRPAKEVLDELAERLAKRRETKPERPKKIPTPVEPDNSGELYTLCTKAVGGFIKKRKAK